MWAASPKTYTPVPRAAGHIDDNAAKEIERQLQAMD